MAAAGGSSTARTVRPAYKLILTVPFNSNIIPFLLDRVLRTSSSTAVSLKRSLVRPFISELVRGLSGDGPIQSIADRKGQ